MEKQLKVLMDHQIFTIQTFGGISRAFTEIYKRSSEDRLVKYDIPIEFSDNEYIQDILKPKSLFSKNNSFLKKLFYYGVNRISSTFKILKGDFDIFLPTYYDPYFLPFLKGKPFLLVLHDMTHELFPETVSKQDRTIEWKKKLVYKANRIIAVSENTKKDIAKFYGIDESKIDVISWATTLEVPKKIPDIKLPKKYILFTGNRNTYKNFLFSLKGIAPILRENKELNFICAGSRGFSEEELIIIEEENLQKQVKHIRFKDNQELAYIYNRALCFVYPSLYEGFGIPILEAFACNCPAIVSHTSSLPEVGGDAVEYFDPTNQESIGSAVKRVVEDDILREEMIKKGRKRLRTFNWQRTGNSFLRIYREVLK